MDNDEEKGAFVAPPSQLLSSTEEKYGEMDLHFSIMLSITDQQEGN